MNRLVLWGILLITALHAFDEMVLVIALPVISADLGADTWYGLIIAGYILASIVGMTWAGKEMDAVGPLRVVLIAATLFASGLVLAVVSWNTPSFIVARLLQGLGGGMGWTLSFGLISLMTDADKKPQAVAAMDIAWIVPSLLAPLVGGYLVDVINWRWIFGIQFPLLLIALGLLYPNIHKLRGDPSLAQNQIQLLIRALRIALGVGLILYLLGSPFGWAWLGLIPAFWCMARPLHNTMPRGWLGLNTPLSACLIIACLSFLGFYATEAYQPLYLIELRGLSTLQAGLILTCASVCWMLGSQITALNYIPGNYAQRLLLGLAVIFVGIALLWVLLLTDASVYWAYPIWAIAGLGMGISFNTARSTAMINTPAGQEGLVSTAISLSVSIGLSLATGFGGAIKNQADFLNAGLESAIIAIWAMSLVISLIAWLLIFFHHRHTREN